MIHFDHPWLLALGLLAIPLAVFGYRSMIGMDATRRAFALGLRAVLLVGLAVMLARPQMVREHDNLTVIGLLDISGSVQRFVELPESATIEKTSTIEYLRRWFRSAVELKERDDRFGLIVFDGKAAAVSTPTRSEYLDDNLDIRMVDGTNIEEALQLGLAMFPADTAKRLVLVSDGNETVGDAAPAARQAAGGELVDAARRAGESIGVPVDVLPLAYRAPGDVQIVRVETPPNALSGQVVTVRVILEATEPTAGELTLLHEGRTVDLNGADPGGARMISVPQGQSVHLAQVELGETPVNRFEATFESAEPQRDALVDNNRAEAFTATPSKGAILILDRNAGGPSNVLAETLRAADLPVDLAPPIRFPTDLLSLQRYDLVVLNNIPAYELSGEQQQMLTRYVDDFGGGLLMIGGEESFGAGGWNGAPLEAILPLEMNPPKDLRLPTAALVLVLDKSGSMNAPVAGARASQQEVANEGAALAIESLRDDTMVGVVTFDQSAYEYVPLRRNDEPKQIADRVRGIVADGGTNLQPALMTAHTMLRNLDVEKKRVVCLSDGQSQNNDELARIAEEMVADGIRITTIAVGDQADFDTLKQLAEIGKGEFYPVRNPKVLPRVLVDSVQVINKPLIKEDTFAPVVAATGSALTAGLSEAPLLLGLVVTAARPEPTITMEMTHPDGEPLLARWQAGVGRVAAFTSDIGGSWSEQWTNWPTAATFWTQLVRSTARPPMSREGELTTTLRDGRLHIQLDTFDRETEDGAVSPPRYLTVTGNVYTPSGEVRAVRLRQTAPDQYETSMPAAEAGNYIVAVTPKQGGRALAPMIGGVSQNANAEFRRYASNIGLLQRIADDTGGRALDLADPQAVDLFDRTGMPRSRSLLPIWRTLLLCALALFLFDVACRRIAWSADGVRRMIALAARRVAPAREQAARSAATLASLQKVGRKDPSPTLEDETPPVRVKEEKIPYEQSAPATEKKADAAAVRDALDQILGRSDDVKKKTPRQSEVRETDAADTDDSSNVTGSLLEAKRRARERMNRRDEN